MRSHERKLMALGELLVIYSKPLVECWNFFSYNPTGFYCSVLFCYPFFWFWAGLDLASCISVVHSNNPAPSPSVCAS
jgi:hypothetical protein